MIARQIARYLARFAAITVVYVLLGKLGLLMVLPPYQVAPIYPASGWGLAVLLVWGLRHAPAVAFGSFLVQASTLASQTPQALPLAAAIGAGAALQALVGALLMHHWCGRPVTLTSPPPDRRLPGGRRAGRRRQPQLRDAGAEGAGLHRVRPDGPGVDRVVDW